MNILTVSNYTFSRLKDKDNVRVIHLKPEFIADQYFTIKNDLFFLNGVNITGIIFCISPETNFSASFIPEDQTFCNEEIKSVLFEIFHNKNIFVLNRYPADIWFNGFQWSNWRELFIKNDIKLSSLNFGWKNGIFPSSLWTNYSNFNFHPYYNNKPLKVLGCAQTNFELSNHVLFIYDKILNGEVNKNILKAIEFLNSIDINFGRILTTTDGKIFSFDPCPEIFNLELKNTLNTILYEKIKTYCSDRKYKRSVNALY